MHHLNSRALNSSKAQKSPRLCMLFLFKYAKVSHLDMVKSSPTAIFLHNNEKIHFLLHRIQESYF